MTRFKSLLVVGLALAAVTLTSRPARAQTPQYTSYGPAAQGTSSSVLQIPPLGPAVTPRIVFLSVDSDKAASVFSFKKGVGAYTVGTNTAAGTALNLQTGVGLANSDTLFIVSPDNQFYTNCTVSSINNVTNITISLTPAFGFTNGWSVYKMSAATTFLAGAKSNNVVTGDAVFVGNQGRPLMVTIDGTSWSVVNSASVRWD